MTGRWDRTVRESRDRSSGSREHEGARVGPPPQLMQRLRRRPLRRLPNQPPPKRLPRAALPVNGAPSSPTKICSDTRAERLFDRFANDTTGARTSDHGGMLRSHFATPRWWEHVPRRWCEKLYVPSRHFAEAPGGAAAIAAGDAGRATTKAAAVTAIARRRCAMTVALRLPGTSVDLRQRWL